MRAIICDRCGTAVTHGHEFTGPFPEVVRPGHYPGELHLCSACHRELMGLLRTWIQAVAKQSERICHDVISGLQAQR